MLRAVILFTLVCGVGHGADRAAAHQAEQAGDFAGAEAIYLELIATQPTADLYQRLGLVRHMQNKFDTAASSFEQAVKLDPELWPSHLFCGIDLYRTNNFDSAYQHLVKANSLHPGEHEVQFWFGATQLARRDYMNGFKTLEAVLARDPTNAEVLRMLAESYGDYGTALLNRVAEEHPGSAAGLVVQGKAFEFEGSYRAALDSYKAAFALDPNRPGLRESIARMQTLAAKSP